VSTLVVVNGRFLTMQATGVQRYARNLVAALPAHVDGRVQVAVPPATLLEAADRPALDAVVVSGRWHGPSGHTWEQAALPAIRRRAGQRAVLLSPANWGPVSVARQLPVFLDIAPQLHPDQFTTSYRALAGVLTPLLVRRCRRIGVESRAVATDISRRYGADPDRFDVIPPGVGAPFDRWPVDDLAARPGRYCLMVGGHDRRKNVAWVLGWWPRAYEELGLELVVTTRGQATARLGEHLEPGPGVSVRLDPDDEELATLYAGALCLLWPSRYEGFGLPLLEAMAVGTPFLATDTGAAAELAIEADQVLPLEPDRWIERLRLWSTAGLGDLRATSVAAARERSWDASGVAAAAALARAAG
jgi:glycosyltransferase involved in cell wall biosynthesis